MKKVLLATMSLDIGGAETHIVELSKQLVRSGFRVYIISNGGVYEETVTAHGITHIKAPLHTKNPISLIKSYKRLRKSIIMNGIDIVHAHARIPAFLCNIICRKLNVPFVTTVHYEFRTSLLFKMFTRWGSYTLSVSRDVQEYLIENYHYNKDRAALTVNGIDSKEFHPMDKAPEIMEELSLSKDDFVIGTVCRIDKGSSKTAFMLVEIAENLAQQINSLRIVITGGGNQFDKLKEKADAVNKRVGRKLVDTTGPRSDINKILSVTDIFTGISRAALEAMAMKKPVVLCGDLGYLGIMDTNSREMAMETNMTCREMATASNTKLQTDLILLYKNTELRNKNAKLNIETVLDYYSVERMGRDAIEMYKKAFGDKKTPPAYYHAVLSGYYGFENSGDEAMLSSILGELRELKADIRLLVLSKKHKEASRIYNVDTINRSNPFSIMKAFRNSGMLISGGGNLVQDLTSFQSMLYYTGLMKYAGGKGMKVMLYANGIGPLNRNISQRIAGRILNDADAITVREPNSYEILERIGVSKPYIAITADPVMGMEPPSKNDIQEIYAKHGIPAEGKKVLFSVRPWKGLEWKFNPVFAKIADYLYEQHNLMPVFIPLNTKKDTKGCQDIIDMMKYPAVLVENENSAVNLISLAGEAELVIGMRLHSLIYASVARTPVIGIVYDPKVRYFIELMEQEDGGDVENLDFNGIRVIVEKILVEREKYVGRISTNMKHLKTQCEKNAAIAVRLLEGIPLDE